MKEGFVVLDVFDVSEAATVQALLESEGVVHYANDETLIGSARVTIMVAEADKAKAAEMVEKAERTVLPPDNQD